MARSPQEAQLDMFHSKTALGRRKLPPNSVGATARSNQTAIARSSRLRSDDRLRMSQLGQSRRLNQPAATSAYPNADICARLQRVIDGPLSKIRGPLRSLAITGTVPRKDKQQEVLHSPLQISLTLADRRRPLRRCRMILVVLGEDRLKGFLGPKFRRDDVSQTGSVPI